MYISYIYEYDFYDLLVSYKERNSKEGNYYRKRKIKILSLLFQLLFGIGFIILPFAVKILDKDLNEDNFFIVLGFLLTIGIIISIIFVFNFISFIFAVLALKKAIKEEDDKKALKLYKYSCIFAFNFTALRKTSRVGK
ncbi:hypothetical protein ACLRE7_02360 [Mycoplasmopsis meleagridis]|uniref:hypothetical protein n=1 Tax=Mycoplasmopsis meleagridis TaxID=29561 RepID=UPI00073D83C3|nr:hypothetical protein [Mycoplasmopsis meleagridis]KUH47549.1 hypothetical protein ASB56_00220 [Mycoplasmopsis meleagridis]